MDPSSTHARPSGSNGMTEIAIARHESGLATRICVKILTLQNRIVPANFGERPIFSGILRYDLQIGMRIAFPSCCSRAVPFNGGIMQEFRIGLHGWIILASFTG